MLLPYVVGVTGGSGSGKTHFLRQLLSHFEPGQVCLMPQDHYYKAIHLVPTDANGIQNFDVPVAIDSEQYRTDILAVRAGQTVQKKEYTFNNPLILPQILAFAPSPIILLEGLFTFYFPEVADLIDLKLFIDAKEAVKLRRRIARDNRERGYDLDDVLYRYEHHASPTYDYYVKPFSQEADFVIPNNKGFDKALDIIVLHLKNVIADRQGAS
jgi:uridine kinase